MAYMHHVCACMQVLQLLQRLTNALGTNCVVMQQFVLGLLDYSLNIEGPEALSLVEDALLLWLVTLRNVAAGTRDSLRLWPHWVTIMATSIEHVQSCMMIASSAILLGQAEFLQVLLPPRAMHASRTVHAICYPSPSAWTPIGHLPLGQGSSAARTCDGHGAVLACMACMHLQGSWLWCRRAGSRWQTRWRRGSAI